MRWLWQRRPAPTIDIDAFFSDLQRAYPGKGSYTKMDRYRDYKRLFQGSEEGKRVLYDIMLLCHITRPSAPLAKFDPYETMFLDGERSIGTQIMVAMHVEPKAQPSSVPKPQPKPR